jgi:hypothetical protein
MTCSFFSESGIRRSVILGASRDVRRRGNGSFHTKRPGDARDLIIAFRPVHQYFLFWRLTVGDTLQRYVWYNPAHFFALIVLLALVNKPARRTARVVIQLVPGESCGEQSLARQRQGHAAGVHRDPSPAPLLGNVSRGAAAAGGIENKIAGVKCRSSAGL